MSRIATEWRSLHTQVLAHRAQLSLSLRLTIAAVLSFMLSRLLHLPLPLWAVLTAVILTQVSFGRSLKATIDYLVGTLGGAVYAGAIAALVPHTDEIALAGVLRSRSHRWRCSERSTLASAHRRSRACWCFGCPELPTRARSNLHSIASSRSWSEASPHWRFRSW